MTIPNLEVEKLRQRIARGKTQFFNGSSAPTNGVTGAGSALKFDLYIRTNASPGAAYINTGTKATPTWTRIK